MRQIEGHAVNAQAEQLKPHPQQFVASVPQLDTQLQLASTQGEQLTLEPQLLEAVRKLKVTAVPFSKSAGKGCHFIKEEFDFDDAERCASPFYSWDIC